MTGCEKILFINPNWKKKRNQKQLQFEHIWQPLDLAIAAALLEKDGFSVQILDNNIECLSSEEIAEKSMEFDKVFVSSTPYNRWQCPSLNISPFFETIRHIPSSRLYVMGAHVTERPEAILKSSRARAAIIYEPEQTILAIAQRDQSADIPNDIKGIAYLKRGRLFRSAPRGYLDDLDQLPYPAFHLLPMDQYHYEFMGSRFTILESSRGCPYRCKFCYLGMYGTKFRQKGVGRFLDEVKYVTKKFNIKNIYFMDLEFGLKRNFLLSFCRALIKHKIDINWCCQTRVTDVDKEVLKCMKNSGCSLIHFGIESGSNRVLNQTGKKIEVSDCIRVLAQTHESGIRTALFLNFGFPGETVEEMEATIDLTIKLNPTYAAFHLIVPFPGTELANEIGLDPESFPATQYPNYNSVHHDIKSLKSMLRRAYLRFYLRPSYLLGVIRTQRGLQLNQAQLFLRLLLG
jgi:radical SAM superfamily enzyme YgiQ (UPF0313 family)